MRTIFPFLTILAVAGCSTSRQLTIGESVPAIRPAFTRPSLQPPERLVVITNQKTGVVRFVTPEPLTLSISGNLLQVEGEPPEVVRFRSCYLHKSAVPTFLASLSAALPVGEALSNSAIQALAEKVARKMANGGFISANPDLSFRL